MVNIQRNIVTCPTYPDKFIRDNVVAPSVRRLGGGRRAAVARVHVIDVEFWFRDCRYINSTASRQRSGDGCLIFAIDMQRGLRGGWTAWSVSDMQRLKSVAGPEAAWSVIAGDYRRRRPFACWSCDVSPEPEVADGSCGPGIGRTSTFLVRDLWTKARSRRQHMGLQC